MSFAGYNVLTPNISECTISQKKEIDAFIKNLAVFIRSPFKDIKVAIFLPISCNILYKTVVILFTQVSVMDGMLLTRR